MRWVQQKKKKKKKKKKKRIKQNASARPHIIYLPVVGHRERFMDVIRPAEKGQCWVVK